MKNLIINKENNELNFNFLMWATVALIVLTPLIREFSGIKFLFNIGLTVMFLSGIYGLASNKKRLIIATVLYIPMFVSTWSDYFPKIIALKLIGNLSGFILAMGLIFFIFKVISRARTVNIELIKAAITAYLLMGVAWTLPYIVVAYYLPNSFSGIEAGIGAGEIAQSLFYFSYITLTTLGYGDITPVSGIAQSLAIVEAIVGQLYLVVVISWLVGIKVGHDLKE